MDGLTSSHLTHHKKSDARRYHALIELIDTEQGYVHDLDILVNIYLANLSALVVPQRTRSSSSFRFSNPETTFSKFTSNHAATSPSTPASSHSQMHEFFAFRDTPTEQRFEQSSLQMPAHSSSGFNMISSKSQIPSMQPLLTEDDSCILARNASALLQLHTSFAQTLLKCLTSSGVEFDSNNFQGGQQTEFLDTAVGAVCDLFIEQAPHFDIYEVFCSGHADALEVMRRAQSAHPVAWDAWELRCAAAHTADTQLTHRKAAAEPLHADHRKEQCDTGVTEKNKFVFNVDDNVIQQDVEKISQSDQILTSSSKLAEHQDLSDLSDIATDKENSLENDSACNSPPPASDASSQSSCPSRHSLQLDPENAPTKSVSNAAETESSATSQPSRHDTALLNSRKLSLADYLIKPIQRICRYPLLLDQLRRTPNERPMSSASSTVSYDNNATSSASVENLSTDDLVERALAAMRRAAQAVDEARRRRDSLARSRIAAARLQAHPRCPFSAPFLEELGACTLVGGLDVVYIDGAEALRQTALHNINRKDNDGALDLNSDPYMHPQSVQYSRTRKSLRAKYLGVFLYNGGYAVLAKPIKAGVYEAKHWFQLAGFDIIDVDDTDGTAILPNSFRIIRPSHRFDLSASSTREKSLWLAALREARNVPPAWQHKPVSSIFLHEEPVFEHDDTSESLQISHNKIKAPVVTKNEKSSRTLTLPSTITPTTAGGHLGYATNIRAPSKSTTSIMSLFTTGSLSTVSLVSDDNSPAVRQTSVTRRAQIDRLFLDVFSESCLVARAVTVRDSKLTTGLPSITTTNRGTTSDTEVVSKSALDVSNLESTSARASPSPFPHSPSTSHDYLAIKGDREWTQSPVILHDDSASTVVLEKFPSHERDTSGHSMSDLIYSVDRPRRSSSIADNVKGFFIPRSSSRSSTTPTDEESPVPGGQHLVARIWRSASLRNRTNSAPTLVAVPQVVTAEPTAIVTDRTQINDSPGVLSRSPTSSSMPVLDQIDTPGIEAEDVIYMSMARTSLDERSFTNKNKVKADQQQQYNSSTIRRLFRPRQAILNSLTPISSVR